MPLAAPFLAHCDIIMHQQCIYDIASSDALAAPPRPFIATPPPAAKSWAKGFHYSCRNSCLHIDPLHVEC